jgi:hypothetical protein
MDAEPGRVNLCSRNYSRKPLTLQLPFVITNKAHRDSSSRSMHTPE